MNRPVCTACQRDEVYDRTGAHPAAVARVAFGCSPYGAKLCRAHLADLQRSVPVGGVQIVERYQQGEP